MLRRAIELIHYENYFQLLQILTKQQMHFAVFDRNSRCLWSSDEIDQQIYTRLQSHARAHPVRDSETETEIHQQQLDSGEWLISLMLHSSDSEQQLNILFLNSVCEATDPSEAVDLFEAVKGIGVCIQNELKLNDELESMADELGERYEELNLVYETDNQDSRSYHGFESLRRMVHSCTEFLDVGMSALLLPDKNISIYEVNPSIQILNPNKLLSSLKQDLYAWLKGHQESVVLNTEQNTRFYHLDTEIPYKLLVSPVDSGEGEVIGMLVIINHNWKDDFCNSDRNILDVMSKKITKIVQANYDALTGLENRASFEWNLQEALSQSQSKAVSHGLLNVDLDGTSVVNDISGREAGDALIRLVGLTISKIVRTRDVVARVGGDEFGVLLDSCPLETANKLAQKISKTISDLDFAWDGKQHEVSACIGVAAITAETESIASLTSAVEVARNAAKERGRSRLQVYQQNDIDLQRHKEEIQWVTRVQAALRENRFQLYGQLIQGLTEDSQDFHYEILLRMTDEKGSVLAPGLFLPAAEHYQLMPGIDRWVIRNTVDMLLESVQSLQGLPVAINLSGQSLSDDGFYDFVRTELDRLGEYKQFIIFEITESAAIANLTDAIQFISQIKSMGCRFSLDDFGTGLSSFAYLQNMDVDYLKIDGSFVSKIETDPISKTMVSAINQVGQAMGLKTIAEYVENESILAHLKHLGVDYAQGYALGKPQPFALCLGESVKHRNASIR